MAKSGVLDSDPTRMARAVELKKELQKLVGSIVDDDDYSVETVDQASAALKELLRLKSSRKKSPPSPPTAATASSCPVDFKCPLSKEMMRDPVILCTGQVSFPFTFSIILWLIGKMQLRCMLILNFLFLPWKLFLRTI
ncbi:U-box domain-containing protein 9 [Linum perenne]